MDPTIPTLLAAAGTTEVRQAFAEVSGALADLRFHEGLRRGWAEARAESAVREAVALSILEGVPANVDDLRARTMTLEATRGQLWNPARAKDRAGDASTAPSSMDPASALQVGLWRAQWNLATSFPPLNTRTPRRRAPVPDPALIGRIHRDICAELVNLGYVNAREVAVPAPGPHMAQALRILRSELPALACAGALVAHFRFRTVMHPASAAVGSTLARWVLVDRGVDPTGVAVVSAGDAAEPGVAGRELAGWVVADEDGVARWFVHFARSLRTGVEVGKDVALHVQARSLG